MLEGMRNAEQSRAVNEVMNEHVFTSACHVMSCVSCPLLTLYSVVNYADPCCAVPCNGNCAVLCYLARSCRCGGGLDAVDGERPRASAESPRGGPPHLQLPGLPRDLGLLRCPPASPLPAFLHFLALFCPSSLLCFYCLLYHTSLLCPLCSVLHCTGLSLPVSLCHTMPAISMIRRLPLFMDRNLIVIVPPLSVALSLSTSISLYIYLYLSLPLHPSFSLQAMTSHWWTGSASLRKSPLPPSPRNCSTCPLASPTRPTTCLSEWRRVGTSATTPLSPPPSLPPPVTAAAAAAVSCHRQWALHQIGSRSDASARLVLMLMWVHTIPVRQSVSLSICLLLTLLR